jgi:hypothetical protein
MSNRILILNRTTISTVDTTVDISQEPVMETELFIPSLFAEKITMRPSNPRIDKWLQPSTSMVVTLGVTSSSRSIRATL